PLDGPYAFGNFIDDAIQGRQIIIKSNGKSKRTYLYAADLIVWLLRLLVKGSNGGVYNVGSPVAVSVLELACKIASHAKTILQPKVLGADSDPFSCYVPKVSKAKNVFGLTVYTPINDAIDRTLRFYTTGL
ncbi:MAG: NAD-dependent epimerase/dehydratase family protein, partial [Chitinophagaceae bacterium]